MNKPTPISAQAARMLTAVERLLVYYQGGYKNEELHWCPLCIASEVDCIGCPWKMFGDRGCIHSGGDDINEKREHPNHKWRVASIERLTKWSRLIQDGTYDRKMKESA